MRRVVALHPNLGPECEDSEADISRAPFELELEGGSDSYLLLLTQNRTTSSLVIFKASCTNCSYNLQRG